MRIIALPLIGALLLAGCTTAQIDQARTIARQSVAGFCAAWPTAYAGFQALAASNPKISQSTIAKANQAARAAGALCSDPPSDTATALAAASRILASLVVLEATAKREAGV